MKRRGVVTIWALVTLAVATVMTATILNEFLALRRSLDARQNRGQAELIAQAGEAIAMAKLQTANDYRGETMKMLSNGDAVITVTAGKMPGTYRVVVVAHFPANQPRAAMKRIERLVRLKDKSIEVVE